LNIKDGKIIAGLIVRCNEKVRIKIRFFDSLAVDLVFFKFQKATF